MANRETTYGKGYEVGLTENLIKSRITDTPLNGTRPGCVVGHGATTAADRMLEGDECPWVHPIILSGIPCMCADVGGTYTWGNDTATTRFADAWTDFQTWGVDANSVVMYGVSMGAIVTLNAAYNRGGAGTNFSAKVKAIVLVLPVLSLQDIVDNDRSGLASSVTTAYGGTPAYSTYSPSVWGPATITGIPILMYYSTNDPICDVAVSTAFAGAMGGSLTAVSLGAVGHSGLAVPASNVATWLRKYV